MRTEKMIVEMQKEIDTLKEKTDKLQEVADWLECHDRDDIDFDFVIHSYFPCRIIRYFYKGEIKTAKLGYADCEGPLQLVRNGEQTIILVNKDLDKYFQIDKAAATVTEIPKPELDDDTAKQSTNDLEKRIEHLTMETTKKIDFLKSKQQCHETLLSAIKELVEKIDDVVEFTNLFGADNINFMEVAGKHYIITYLYDNAKHRIDYRFDGSATPICIKNGDIAILECGGKYYQLDREKETIVEIPKPAFVTEKKLKTKNGEKDNKKTSA